MKTSIYLVCFHSHDRQTLEDCSGQYRIVEEAIQRGEWPYDNGDDPSFFVARAGGPLTWGVCRQNLRTAIQPGSIVVFSSFSEPNPDVVYRLCAVATVVDKLDRRMLYRDKRFTKYRDLYINGLIEPDGDGWRHSEDDRPKFQRHDDWLWRIADHHGMTHATFDKLFNSVYQMGRLREADIGRTFSMGKNYVLFSAPPDRAYISPDPPDVARFSGGAHEQWCNGALQELTVIAAARHHRGGRDYLRVKNSSGRNLHRHIRFGLPIDEANHWRDQLITALRQAPQTSSSDRDSRRRTGRQARLGSRRATRC